MSHEDNQSRSQRIAQSSQNLLKLPIQVPPEWLSPGGDTSPKLWGAHGDAPLRELAPTYGLTLTRLPQLPRLLEAEQLQLGLELIPVEHLKQLKAYRSCECVGSLLYVVLGSGTEGTALTHRGASQAQLVSAGHRAGLAAAAVLGESALLRQRPPGLWEPWRDPEVNQCFQPLPRGPWVP